MRVLIVEDEPRMGELIRRVLVAERFGVDLAEDAVAGLALAGNGGYDAIVLDRMLPDLDGTEVLQLLRGRGDRTPVLMLTALGSVEQRVVGLDAGADDYLTKPFAFAELLARLRALGRRPVATAEERLVAGDIELDQQRHVARVGDASVELTAREFALLAYLIRNAGRVLSRRQILDAVWGAEPDVYSNVVDLYVSYLRRKLATLGRGRRLRTVRGVGYTLSEA
ncbi:MAG: response regulator transcription factor [Candidatus Limnocylindrales bacterium]